jgi:4-amino-4-deoxy-L-arabinose transferase-like glycosyltransferase
MWTPGGRMSVSDSVALRRSRPGKGLAGLFDFAVSSNRRAISVLALVCLIAFLPGFFSIPPVDRDEANFAQATKQMIETGHYVDIRFQDRVQYSKPIGIYWLQAAVVKSAELLGVPNARSAIWLYRIPSLIGAIGGVLATYWCALAFVSRRGAMLAALTMASSIILGIQARLATIDAMLLPLVVGAMGVLARAYLSSRGGRATQPGWGLAAVFWTALAAGVLLKGPVIVTIVALTVLALSIVDRSVRWLLALRPLAGVAFFIVLALPWFVAISMRTGDAFVLNSVVHDALGKIVFSQEAHGAPPGYYLVLFFVTFFPAATLAMLAVPAVWAGRREYRTRFLLAWLVPAWLLFELSITKLPHYVMPVYPAIAILLAGAVEANVLARARWLADGLIWWFLFPVIVGIAAVTYAIIASGKLVLPASLFFAGAVFCGFTAWMRYRSEGAERALTCATAASVLLAIGLYGIVVPALKPLFPSVTLAETLRQSGCAHPVAASVGYEEPSLVFLLGTETHLTDAAGAADFLQQGGCRFAFVETSQEGAFAARAQAIGLRYDAKPRLEAFNFSNVRPITIAVFQSPEGDRD